MITADKLIEQLISGERFFDGFSDAYLAGGAVRDSLLGKPVSDYDLFITSNVFPAEKEMFLYSSLPTPEVRLVFASKMLRDGEYGVKIVRTSKEYYKDSDFQSYRSVDGKLNVMICRSSVNIQQRIMSFPVSLSQIGIRLDERGHGKLVVGDGFKWSMEKRLALYHTKDEYVKKVMAKYSDWEWAQVAPDDFRMGGRLCSITTA